MSGKIKSYTKHYKFIIPEFNVATWHDFVEENFRSIDALFQNLFGINNFSGMWKTNTEYKANQVLFVGEDNGSQYEGRLVKITQDTNTGGFATFSEAIKRYPTHYEMFADANSAEIFANLSKDWATYLGSTVKTPTGEDTGEYSAKHYAQVAGSHEESCEMYKNLAKTNSDLAKESENIATVQAQIATTQAEASETSAQNAKTSETNAQSFANSSKQFSEASEQSAKDSEYYALISSPPPLLSHIWSDHVLNDIRYLRADTFSWQDADVYDAVYSHLLEDYKNLSAETETVGDYTITFYRANDGHKIVLPNMEETVKNIYNNTGVSWYYILDIENRRFKLPRTKWGFVGNRNKVGDSVDVSANGSGVKATQSYLYFYVGNYTKSAIEQTAGLKTELLNNKVDTDLKNVQIPHNSVGFAKYSTEVTNCITEIPQDIKLELNNGDIVIKAGTKYYVPRGTNSNNSPVFASFTLLSDKIVKKPTKDGVYMIFLEDNSSKKALAYDINTCTSGDAYLTFPAGGVYYRTGEYNRIYEYMGNSQMSDMLSLPLVIATFSGGSFTSLDQIFNGFGYIGSTVFALPGIKGLIPKGRNADGTLKNIEVTLGSVLTNTITIANESVVMLLKLTNEVLELKSTRNKTIYYDYNHNYVVVNGDRQTDLMCCIVLFDSNKKITALQPKNPFHALDYNDKSTIVGWSMPSDKYIDLTLGASGTSYTVPANGWIVLRKIATALGQSLYVGYSHIADSGFEIVASGSNQNIGIVLPVSKEQMVYISYTANGNTKSFRFIYAEGEN